MASAWGKSWGLAFGAAWGLVAAVQPAPVAKSSASRQWLIEYYTEAFRTKPVEAPVAKGRAVTRKKAALVEAQREKQVTLKIEKLVTRAERDVAEMTAKAASAAEAQQVLDRLIQTALQLPKLITDFKAIGDAYSRRIQDDDLMLFALGMAVGTTAPKLSDEAGELMLLTFVL